MVTVVLLAVLGGLGGGEEFVRGDANGDGAINVSDLTAIGDVIAGDIDGCDDAADVNDDGAVNTTDLVYLSAALFRGGSPPSAPWPTCGEDPTTGDPLDCPDYDCP